MSHYVKGAIIILFLVKIVSIEIQNPITFKIFSSGLWKIIKIKNDSYE